MIIEKEKTLCKEFVNWQHRLINSVYLIIWLDKLSFVKDKSKTVFIISGINKDGFKEVLGLWIGEESDDSFWLHVLTDIKARGCRDIMITCSENICGFEDNMKALFLDYPIHTRMINLMERTAQFITSEDRCEYNEDMRKIYAASTWDEGDLAYKAFAKKWRDKYPFTIRRFDQKPHEFITFFTLPKAIREIIYSTKIKDSLEKKIKEDILLSGKDDEAILQSVYLLIQENIKKWNNPIRNWELVLK